MKGKRLTALLLAVLMTMTLFPAASAAAPESDVMPNITYATDPAAFVKNVSIGQSSAWNLTVKADLTNAGNVYAVVMHYDDFAAQYNDNGKIGNILPSNYNALEGVSKKSYYYHQSTSGASQGAAKTLLDKQTFNFSSTIGESSTTYHQHYALILFDGGTTVQDLSDYTIADFYVDSQGKLQTQSYMLRYCANNGSAGASKANAANLPKYQIEGWGTAAAVAGTDTAQNPTRKGYTFVGWTDKTHKNAMGDDANKAAALEVSTENVLFARGAVTPSLGWGTVSGEAPGFGTTSYDRAKDQFFDLYALWRPVPVTLAPLDQAAGAEKQTTTAKVGVTFAWKYEAGGSYDDSAPRDHGGNTTRNITAQYSEDGGTQWKTGLPAGLGLATGKQDRAMTYSSLNVQATNADPTPEFLITGQPTQYSKVPITIRLTATDQSNGTTATQDLVLSEIQKGDQKVQPDEDVNTGLETRVDPIEPETPDTPESMEATTGDGVLYGFYSKGQTDAKANGTGSLRNYYLDVKGTSAAWNEALIYEYKPAEAADLPDNWREVPLPKELYSTDQLAKVQTAMALNAKARCASTYAASGMTVTDSTPGNDVAPWAGWPESYGEIHFRADGAPEIHGLTVGVQYEVRFKENSDYGASAAKTFTITAGGGSSSGPTGYSLVFNLMGGKAVIVKTELSETEGEPPTVTETDVTAELFQNITGLAEGQSVSLPWPELGENETLEFRREGYTFQGFTDGAAIYSHPDQWTYTMPGSCAALSAVWKSTYVDLSGARTVTFLDWDGTTQLAVTAVNQGQGLEAESYANLMNTLVNDQAGHFEGFAFTPNEANEGYVFNPYRLPSDEEGYIHRPLLTDKGGYTFVGWIPGESEKCHFDKGDVPEGLILDLNEYIVNDYVTLKACYEANNKGGSTKEYNQRLYSLYFETISRTGNSYTVEVTVARNYLPELGMYPARLYDPILKVTLKQDTEVALSANIENQDVAKAVFTFPNNYSAVKFELADMDGVTLVSLSSLFSDSLQMDSSGDVGINYAQIGTATFVNEKCQENRETSATTISGLSNTQYNVLFSIGNLTQRHTGINQAWRALNQWAAPNSKGEDALPGVRYLTLEQMTASISQAINLKTSVANVFFKYDVTFSDDDPVFGCVGGAFSSLELVRTPDSSKFTKTKVTNEITGFRVYWSQDGLKKGSEVPCTLDNGTLSIPNGTVKTANDRFLMICALNGETEFPCSAVVPIWDVGME